MATSPKGSAAGENGEGLTILGALAQLKQEITQIQDDAIRRKERPMFLIEGGELELKLVARRERKLDGKLGSKFRLYVFDGEASASASQGDASEAVQTLKLRFSALGVPAGAGRPSDADLRAQQGLSLGGGSVQLPAVETPTDPKGQAGNPFGFS